MSLNRNAPDLAPLRILLRGNLWARFEQLVAPSGRGQVEASGVQEVLKANHMSETDRRLVTLAYALWRGFGPAVEIHGLWGMERAALSRMLAAIAVAVDPQHAAELLKEAIEHVDADTTDGSNEDAAASK